MKDDMGGDAAAAESATTEQNATNGEYQNLLFQRWTSTFDGTTLP